MALTLNEEQRYLKDTANSFFSENAPVDTLRSLRDAPTELGYDPALYNTMVELGWSAVTFKEAVGGLDFGYLGMGAIIEESGRTLTASPLFSSVVLGGSAIELAGSEAQQQQWLPQIIDGSITCALALEETHFHAPTAINLTATKQADGYLLNGDKQCVIDGHSADQLIVVARRESGLSLFLVDATTQGVCRQRLQLVDSRNAANITFDNVQVSADCLLGEEGQGQYALEQVLDRGRICLAAEMLGGIQEIFERTVAYLKERKQFGVLIGSFQALQHRAAQMFVEIELAKTSVLAALDAIDSGSKQLPLLASLAKQRVNQVYELVSNEAIQLHGGIGVTDELDLGLFLKRARVCQQLLGDASFHKQRYAGLCGY